MVRQVLIQARLATYRLIDENPTIVSFERFPLKADGFGGYVKDTQARPSIIQAKVRISSDSGGAPGRTASPVGMTKGPGEFVTMGFDIPLDEGDIISSESSSWKVGPLTLHRAFGGVSGAVAPLVRVK